jgi:hypothetical protein
MEGLKTAQAARAITRRSLLGGGAALGLSAVVPASSRSAVRHGFATRWASGSGARIASAATTGLAGLPTAAQVRADFQTMVDFGPRLCGSAPHNAYIEWLEREFVAAGLQLVPCDVYETSRWSEEQFGLDLLDGSAPGPVTVASYFPRSQQTPAGGVTGPLVYGGTMPAPSMNGTGVASFEAALADYPAEVESWAQALPSLLGDPRGSVLLVDLPMPLPLTAGELLTPLITYYNGQGETLADLATDDYKRLWLVPGLALPLDSFTAMGVAGVVLIADASLEALQGCYAPFEWFNEGVPAIYVDRDTGTKLRSLAESRPSARLTLTATRTTVPTPAVTAVLPGASDETIIFNTHTDGTGFVEENGGVAFVHLARYFASLPAAQRLKRTLVFAAWPGHFSNDLPQADGWIADHEEFVKQAAAALTVEHLGCTEWNDSTATGYGPTGRAELFAVWTTQGLMFETTRDAVIAHNLPRTALCRPPAQFGVGGPFQTHGVPQIGAIAGPEYLLTVSPSGDMEKLDATLAAQQIAWLADLATRLDPIPSASLRQGDPTLGAPSTEGNLVPSSATSKPVACQPPVPPTPGCPRATGRLSGRTLGLVRLGMTRAQALRAYLHSSNRGRAYEDFFCLTPSGVRVGYASPMLLSTLPAGERDRYAGRVVWASTSNDSYSLRGVRPGDAVSIAREHLHMTGPFHIGLNDWYLTPSGAATGVLKVRHGIVEEIGIAERSLTRGHLAALSFLRSFS